MADRSYTIHISSFEDSGVNWETYTEVLNHQFKSQSVPEDIKVSCFLGKFGFKTGAVLKDEAYPAKAEDKKYDELAALIKAHIDPPPFCLVMRMKFGLQVQREKESVMTYRRVEKATARL
jgi:hypothetical protein